MRKVEKDLSVVPKSLDKGGVKSKRRGVCVNGYPTSNTSSSKKDKDKVKKYDSHFKQKDTLDKLHVIYSSKCAFCEEKIKRVNEDNIVDKDEKNHSVEHYRPKSKYPWLAYSWDNLLWSCIQCNKNKSNDFDIKNIKVNHSESFDSKIHHSTKLYNRLERPKMVHPELEDVMDKLIFDTKGNISSHDDRVQYTIDCCKLDRTYLNGRRKKIYDRFFKKLEDAIAQNNQDLIDSILLKFKDDSENMDNEFIAFRVWVLNNI